MSDEKFERDLRAANPVGKPTLDALEVTDGEAALGEAIVSEPSSAAAGMTVAAPRRRPRSLRPLIAGATALAAVVAIFLASGGASSTTEPAYGAQLVRFAESTPLLLLEGPDWRVQNVTQTGQGVYLASSSQNTGSMEFVTGERVPPKLIEPPCDRMVRSKNGKYAICLEGTLPAAVRQRKVELRWFRGSLADTVSYAQKYPHPSGQHWVELPVLETRAQVDTRAELFTPGGPRNRRMVAFWAEDGYVLEMNAWVPDLAAFEERLGWLTRVDSETWLNAMPDDVVKAADHDAAVREMLRGIPVPDGFSQSLIPDEDLTTNRSQVAASVTGVVACQWFLQWGEARREGDRMAEAEAERAMATSRRWPILREMAEEGNSPPLIWQLADYMPTGRGKRGWRLLPQAEALACARLGMPVLPWKQKRQRERSAEAEIAG